MRVTLIPLHLRAGAQGTGDPLDTHILPMPVRLHIRDHPSALLESFVLKATVAHVLKELDEEATHCGLRRTALERGGISVMVSLPEDEGLASASNEAPCTQQSVDRAVPTR